jgi:hypothetical protein
VGEEIVNKLIEYLDAGGDFVKEQAPDVINQMINYGTWDARFGLLVFSIGMLIGAFLFLGGVLSDCEGFQIGGSVLGVFAVVLCICGLCSNYSALKKIEIAPKVYLLEQLRGAKNEIPTSTNDR